VTAEQGSVAAAASGFAFSWRTLRLLALLFLAVRLALIVVANPFMDETYYWMWGQHPALSYFDHPPLIAWTEGLSAGLFGWNKVALRLPVVLTFMADLGLLYLFARRLGGEVWREWFWLTALLFATTPIFVLMSSVALPDHLMIALLLAALYCFQGVLIAHDAGRRDRRPLYLGALAFGLALLAKYYAALFGLGLIVFLAGSR
jgi:4-amino-4-deoxy-L-arabinose transferase-like glycosyltransferase